MSDVGGYANIDSLARPFDLQPTLVGEKIALRPLVEGDYDALYGVGRDPAIWEQHPQSNRYEEPVFREFFGGALRSGGALAIRDRELDRQGDPHAVIGSSRYYDLDPGRSVFIGYTFLTRERWGDGTNRELKGLMLAHAFRFVPRVFFHVGDRNHRSQAALTKIGARFFAKTEAVDPYRVDGSTTIKFTYVIDRDESSAAKNL